MRRLVLEILVYSNQSIACSLRYLNGDSSNFSFQLDVHQGCKLGFKVKNNALWRKLNTKEEEKVNDNMCVPSSTCTWFLLRTLLHWNVKCVKLERNNITVNFSQTYTYMTNRISISVGMIYAKKTGFTAKTRF